MLVIISQIIGIVAVALYLLSYQFKNRTQIVVTTCISNALYVLQYILLGAFSGAVMDFLSTLSSYFAARKDAPRFKPFAKRFAFINLVVIGVVGLVLALIRQDPIELLPIAGALFQTGGLWFDDEKTIRIFGLFCNPFWLAYNFLSRAYGAALGSVLAITSIIIAMVRYRKRNKENSK